MYEVPYGKNVQGTRTLFNHGSGVKYVNAYQMVTLLVVVNGSVTIPFDFRLTSGECLEKDSFDNEVAKSNLPNNPSGVGKYKKDNRNKHLDFHKLNSVCSNDKLLGDCFTKKNALATGMLKHLVQIMDLRATKQGVDYLNISIVADSWYLCGELLEAAREVSIDSTMMCKKSIVVTNSYGKQEKVSDLCERLCRKAASNHKTKGNYRIGHGKKTALLGEMGRQALLRGRGNHHLARH